ncbi:MAG TPA: hypothetical protein PK573_13445, partial [Spirochaetota bacterium]|nr:hypothetical protein [Spirochaetota bacterium]
MTNYFITKRSIQGIITGQLQYNVDTLHNIVDNAYDDFKLHLASRRRGFRCRLESSAGLCKDTRMAERATPIIELAKRGDWRNLEDRFLEEIESTSSDQAELIAALNALSKQGQAARAAELAWAW